MKKYFRLEIDHKTELSSAITKTIKHFYPTGLSSHEAEYHKYAGVEELKEITGSNIGDNKIYKKRWGSFLNFVRKESGKQVNSTTYGFVPGYSADLILDNFEDEFLIRTKRIAFAVSLLGPFFSICGVDETFIKVKNEGMHGAYHAINVVTASPYMEFENDFNGIKYWIEKKFPGYKFVPFFITMMHLKDTETLYSMGQEGTVYNALFNHLFNFYTHYKSRGDQYYGHEKSTNIKVTLTAPPKID
jgi:hypothetical protein